MEDITGLIADRIKVVNDKILSTIHGDVPSLVDAMRHYPSSGGKRLRPVLALVAGGAVGGRAEDVLPYAFALELTHNFTLVHDDLMDNDDMRRGKVAVHKQWDDATAINAGDALFALSFNLLADLNVEHGTFRELLKDFADMVRGVAEGQQLDMEFEDRPKVTEEEYMMMIEKKTALMFQYAAKGGTLIGGGTREQVEAMSEYGRLLGIGFQIWDDILDLEADEEVLGKPVASDIRNGKRTLMAVWATENLRGKDKEDFMKAFDNESATKTELSAATEALERGGGIAYAKRKAREYSQECKRLLSVIPESQDKSILLALADYVVDRKM